MTVECDPVGPYSQTDTLECGLPSPESPPSPSKLMIMCRGTAPPIGTYSRSNCGPPVTVPGVAAEGS